MMTEAVNEENVGDNIPSCSQRIEVSSVLCNVVEAISVETKESSTNLSASVVRDTKQATMLKHSSTTDTLSKDNDRYALILSIGFALVFFGFNTAQNFVVPLLVNLL